MINRHCEQLAWMVFPATFPGTTVRRGGTLHTTPATYPTGVVYEVTGPRRVSAFAEALDLNLDGKFTSRLTVKVWLRGPSTPRHLSLELRVNADRQPVQVFAMTVGDENVATSYRSSYRATFYDAVFLQNFGL